MEYTIEYVKDGKLLEGDIDIDHKEYLSSFTYDDFHLSDYPKEMRDSVIKDDKVKFIKEVVKGQLNGEPVNVASIIKEIENDMYEEEVIRD